MAGIDDRQLGGEHGVRGADLEPGVGDDAPAIPVLVPDGDHGLLGDLARPEAPGKLLAELAGVQVELIVDHDSGLDGKSTSSAVSRRTGRPASWTALTSGR
ncbi:MAG: hypothetical protein ACRD0Q_04345 [Acidimicrobiales bacterium]